MLSPALLVVFVMSPARVEATTRPFERAARQVLGPTTELRVEAVPSPLSDVDALERAGAAEGVVEMRWSHQRQTVVLHCYIAGERRWVDRTIRFESADRDAERGKLLGFAVASMFVDAPGFSRTAEPASVESLPEPEFVAPSTATSPSSASSMPPEAGATRSTAALADATPAQPGGLGGGPRFLEFAGVATSGASGTGELGALAAFGVPVSEPLSLRFQFAGRQGEIAAAQSTVRRAIAGVGVSWATLPESSPVELRLRVGALGSWLQVSHLSSDDVASVKSHRWLFGGEAVATLGYRVSNLLTVFVGVGMEAMSGQTHVFTHGVERGVVTRLRGLGEVGFFTHL